jgi:oxygen-independent coproporphyrinogen-3 oxidase
MSTSRDPRSFPEGLYLHLPFCQAICTYCDFASEEYAGGRSARYLAALNRELGARVKKLLPEGEKFRPRTIFLGGGTPSTLSIQELELFFKNLAEHVDWSSTQEFTIEANPGSTEPAKLETLLKHGVNRISFGVQSFQPHLLKLLGRVHGANQGREAVALARAAGFTNVSIDLMHGLPTQSQDDVKRDLEEALNLQTPHLSAYGLIYEDGTPLKNAVNKGIVQRLSPDEESAQYQLVLETLDKAGLPPYEISNYAKPGFEAQHNLIYWRNEAYLAAGVSSAAYTDFQRYVNFYSMDEYMKRAESGIDPAKDTIESSEVLSPDARARESLVLELRLRKGVDPKEFSQRWDVNWEKAFGADLAKYQRQGFMEKLENGRWRITMSGLPVADGILSEFV